MPTIEKKPLPPIGSGSVTINPSDKEDVTRRARDVIDHYMSGKGSWWDEGTRKSAQQTVDDLKRFKVAFSCPNNISTTPARDCLL
jgi:hypothetical protein